MLYWTKCWVVKNQHRNKLSVENMRMCGIIRQAKTKNYNIRESVGVSYIVIQC